jgi:hypothetical protein
MATHQLSDEIRRNFHLFWDNYPAAVILIHKDRTIMEINKVAEERGYPVGVQCISMGEKKHHASCKLINAMREKCAARDVDYIDFLGQVVDTYWIPLAGTDDFYIHFANDITEWAKESMIPKKCETASSCTACNQA